MIVDQALHRMELLGHDFSLFLDAECGRPAWSTAARASTTASSASSDPSAGGTPRRARGCGSRDPLTPTAPAAALEPRVPAWTLPHPALYHDHIATHGSVGVKPGKHRTFQKKEMRSRNGVYARPHRRVAAGKCRRGLARSFVGSQRLSVGTGTRICLPSSDGLKPALQLRIAYTKAGN
jgi:hypothetical protein